MTKKTILRTTVAIAALAAAACTKTTVSTKSDDGSYIHFSTAVSRAVVDDASDISEFGVWLYKDNTSVLTNQKVYLSGTSWLYDDLQKWTDGPHLFGFQNLFGSLDGNLAEFLHQLRQFQRSLACTGSCSLVVFGYLSLCIYFKECILGLDLFNHFFHNRKYWVVYRRQI